MASRSPMQCLIAALASVATLALFPSPLHAAIDEQRAQRLALPTRTGLGVWLLAGPVANASSIQPNLVPGTGFVEGQRWRTVVRPAGTIDWAKELRLESGKSQSAVLGNWLRVAQSFDGWLLLSADGIVRIAIDGRWVYARASTERARAVAPIPIKLAPGLHSIIVTVERHDHRSAFSLELRDARSGQVPTDMDVLLPDAPAERVLLTHLIKVEWSLDVSHLPLTVEARLSTPGGAPRKQSNVTVGWSPRADAHRSTWNAGPWDLNQAEPFVVRVGLVERLSSGADNELSIDIGDAKFTSTFSLSGLQQEQLTQAIRLREVLVNQESPGYPFDALGATLDHHLRRMAQSLFVEDLALQRRTAAELQSITKPLAAGQDPFKKAGWLSVAIRSRYDAKPQELLIQVPALPQDQDKRLPMVVLLHGYDGSPRSIMEAFLDSVGPKATVNGIVLAPEAHGNAFYRGAGEQSVYDAINWAMQTYPVDPKRVSITGVSMGGTGAAEIAFRRSDTFASAAPLCGYQSFFVRRDTANKALRPWERLLMHTFSPASMAESGHDIPLHVAHGTKDRPIENSRVLTQRYKELHQPLVEDWPDLGHSVWKKTYRNAGLFPWLTRWRKDVDPPYVSLTTGLLRNGRKFWVELTELLPSSELSHIDVRVESREHLIVRTRAVAGFCIHPSQHVNEGGPVFVTVNEQTVSMPQQGPRCLQLESGRWLLRTAPLSGLRKMPSIEGPWSDLLAEPLVVVYGCQNPLTCAINRWVANRLFEAKGGVTLTIPVMSDREFEKATPTQPRAVYVGRPDDHLQMSRIAARLPIRVTPTRIEIGDKAFEGAEVGAVFVYPDPERPTRLLGFVTANGPEGLLRALSLPALVPDFMVFDQGLAPAAMEPILGPAAYVRAAGFFRADWSLPANFDDPFSEKRSR